MSARSGPAGRCTQTERRPPGALRSATASTLSCPGPQAGAADETEGVGAPTRTSASAGGGTSCRPTRAPPAPSVAEASPAAHIAPGNPISRRYLRLILAVLEL